jgi:hypothetical protein
VSSRGTRDLVVYLVPIRNSTVARAPSELALDTNNEHPTPLSK